MPQVPEPVLPIQLSHERPMDFVAAGEELAQFAGAVEANGFPGQRFVHAARVDRLVLLDFSELADRIVIFQGKPQRVNHGMAVLTRGRFGLKCDPLTSRHALVEPFLKRRHRDRRRFQRSPQHAPHQIDAAMDRRTRRVVGKIRHRKRMGQHTG